MSDTTTRTVPIVAPPGYCCRGWCWLPRDQSAERHNLPWDPSAHGPDRPPAHVVGRPWVRRVDGQWRVGHVVPVDVGLAYISRAVPDHATGIRAALATGHISATRGAV